MCNQTAGLIARALEEVGITTVTLSLLKEVTSKINPPRVLEMPFGFGHPLGNPDDREGQTRVLQTCLDLACQAREPGTTWKFDP